MQLAPAPLFCDPIFDGATDPTVIWNPTEGAWWIVYTQRRANVPCRGVSWVHGTALGVASSADGGKSWLYRGTLELEASEPGLNSYWAPEILCHEGVYHMYVSFVRGVPEDWSGERHILHYTSRNLWNWRYESVLELSSQHVIDACVYPLPQGGWRMWYKDEAHESHSYAADSADLYHWLPIGPQTEDCAQEGPNVFALGGTYFLVADMWDGMAVYHSDDLTHWTRNPQKLLSDGGTRADDNNRGHHADVLVVGDAAYLFYFVHPGANEYSYSAPSEYDPYQKRRSSLQVARLTACDGQLLAERDAFDFVLTQP
ncbi:MAG: glycosyl hydrolase [Clostridia bacterium]